MSPDKDPKMEYWHREKLQGQAYLHFGCAGLFIVVLLFLVLPTAIQSSFAGRASLAFCGVVGFVILCIVMLSVHGWNALQDTQEELAVVEGTIKLQSSMAGRVPVFSLTVANERFNIPYQKYKELQNGERYRIRYGPRSKIVVDTELL